MATKVTVDAHAGWAVEVTMVELNPDGSERAYPGTKTVVAANTRQDFYVTSLLEVRIKELPSTP